MGARGTAVSVSLALLLAAPYEGQAPLGMLRNSVTLVRYPIPSQAKLRAVGP